MKQTNKIVLMGLFIALGLVVPSVFHTFGMIAGKIFLPLHLTVLLAGFVCGPTYGLIGGVLTVLVSSLINGMPPMGPIAYSMMIELAAYGFVSGWMYEKTNKVFISLIAAQVAGRVVMAIVDVLMYATAMSTNGFVLSAFISSAFITAFPGIVIQLILIPMIVLLLRKHKLMK